MMPIIILLILEIIGSRLKKKKVISGVSTFSYEMCKICIKIMFKGNINKIQFTYFSQSDIIDIYLYTKIFKCMSNIKCIHKNYNNSFI